MKTLISMLILLNSVFAMADNYTETMQASIEKLLKAHTTEELNQLAGLFNRIGQTEQSKWLPYYYSAYAYTRSTFFTKEDDEIDASLDKAQAILEQLRKMEADQSEVHVLQALIYSMRISASPMSAYKYSTLSEEALVEAEKINPNNPRIHYCRGNNVLHTPKMFGGGATKALKHFQKAQALFDSSANDNPLLPTWGLQHNKQMLAQCQKEK